MFVRPKPSAENSSHQPDSKSPFFGWQHALLHVALIAAMLMIAAAAANAAEPADSSADPNYQAKFTAAVPPGGLSNIHALTAEALARANREGRAALLEYPAQETTLAVPYYAISRLYSRLNYKPLLRRAVSRRGLSGIGRSWADIYARAGLVKYPRQEGSGAYFVPFPHGKRPQTPMGMSVFRNHHHSSVFTLSCASCHTRNLFGRPVLGASNLQGGTGNTLMLLKKVAQLSDFQFRFATRPSGGEFSAFHKLQHQISFVQGKHSQAKGLENPVAFVGLSLNGREKDEHSTRTWRARGNSWRSSLRKIATDSKPPVLWNLKYKNRFQHDGSMTGDPMLANLIFNEIGRGADLKKLAAWVRTNQAKITAMSAAAYAMEAPRWTDFFHAESIDVAKARRGEMVFNQRCARCHGSYEKAWSDPDSPNFDKVALLKTLRVVMPKKTLVKNVGTDPGRSQAMVELAPLANRLAIFRDNGISFEAHPGKYVPPPLVGIWARWPYMHNNSIANLDQLLTPAKDRVPYFYVGPALDVRRDYDQKAVGFPLGKKTPRSWITWSRLFDTRKPGLSNSGHDEGIFVRDGVNLLSPENKSDLIEFLKTL